MSNVQVTGPVALPTVKAVNDRTKADVTYNLNCVQVGRIISYKPTANTCSVEIMINKVTPINKNNINQNQPSEAEQIIIAPLQDCPVFYLNGGGSFVSMPIQPGDSCLVLFNDRDIDAWWATGEKRPPQTTRAHSFSDAIVLVGIQHQKNTLPVNDEVLTVNGGPNKILITNQDANLLDLISTLIQTIETLTIQVTGLSGVVSPASQQALQNVQQQFTTLLSENL